jgi:hypothetical protein
MKLISASRVHALLLKRAKHHVRDLKAVVDKFTLERPWTYLIDAENQVRNLVHTIKVQELPPADVACILFDAVNDLRAALDQIGYSAAIASGKGEAVGYQIPVEQRSERPGRMG